MRAHRAPVAVCFLGLLGLGASACSSDTLGAVPCRENTDCSVGEVCIASVCEPSICGDGIVDERVGESCDDQDADDTDGCSAECVSPLPELSLTEPSRGETRTGAQSIAVRGSLETFGATVSEVLVNGTPASFDGVNFEAAVQAQHGLNAIKVEATNEYGRTGVATAGVYHSSAYLPFAAEESATPELPGGIVSRLGQAAFDDGDHPCSFAPDGTYTCAVVDDLATLAELLLNNLDFENDLGTLPVFTQTFPIFEQLYPLGQTTFNLLGFPVTLSGTMALQGFVNLRVEVNDLDLDRLRVALATRTGGIDVDLNAGGGFQPGVAASIRSSASLDTALRFTSLSADIDGFDSLLVACPILSAIGIGDPVAAGIVASMCVQPDGRRAPLAGVEPTALADSSFTIGEVELLTGYDVSTAAGGGINVQLRNGTVDFKGSAIDLNALENMLIDLKDVTILGGATTYDLGEIPLENLAQGFSSALDPIADYMSNNLQSVLQVGINGFLLNQNDPLALSNVLEYTILSFAPNGALGMAPIAGSTPAIQLSSSIDAIRFTAAAGSMNRGGMEISAASLYSAPRINPRPLSGTILRDSCYGLAAPQTLEFSQQAPIEQAIALDAMNQSLYAAWYNAGFDGRLSGNGAGEIDVSYDVVFDPLTPPILEDCGGRLELQIADVRVSGVVDGANVDLYTSMSIPVNVGVNAVGALELVPEPVDQWLWQAQAVGADRARATRLGGKIAELTGRALAAGGTNAVLNALPPVEIDFGDTIGLTGAPVLTHVPDQSYRSHVYSVRSGARVVR